MMRRCDNLKDREDLKIADLAKEMAASKDDYDEESILTVLDSSNNKLSYVAHDVGWIQKKKIDIIDYNINLIKLVEQVRVDLWINNNSNKNINSN